MLVAKRDPFHSGAHDVQDDLRGRGAVPGLARTMTMLQVLGSLLAIPVGIGSAYSLYRANFSVETTCQSLRSNIVSMLDRRVDAGTRHMLVRHDVESFERTCGAVDPDATAAFKALLTAKLVVPPVQRVEVIPAVKTEPKQEAAVKPKAPPPVAAATAERVEHDAAVSDAAWIAAVREALVTGKDEPAPSAPAVETVVAQPAPQQQAVRPVMREIRASAEAPAQPPLALSPPALPPATSITNLPAPHQQADDHPVPPAPIPYAATTAKESGGRSRLAELVAQIPLVGRAMDAIDGRH